VGSHDGSFGFEPVLSIIACGEPINRRMIGSHMVRVYAPPTCGCVVCALARLWVSARLAVVRRTRLLNRKRIHRLWKQAQ
jgi:hypothetical protein